MESKLLRIAQDDQGAIGIMYFENADWYCFILQPDENDKERYHLPAGKYKARRFHGIKWPNTFEIVIEGTNSVNGHTSLLFHAGNTEVDSLGCSLMGSSIGKLKGDRAVLNSGDTFKSFLEFTKDIDKFDFEVIDIY
jgi:hypothetical protein